MVVPTVLPGTRNPSKDDASEASRSSYTDDYSMQETVMTPLFSFGAGWLYEEESYASGFSKSIEGSFDSGDESETFISQGGEESYQGSATDGHTIASSVFDGITVSGSVATTPVIRVSDRTSRGKTSQVGVKPNTSWQMSGRKLWKSQPRQMKGQTTRRRQNTLERVVEKRDSMTSGSCSMDSNASSEERDSVGSSESDSLCSEDSPFRTTCDARGSVIAAPSRRPSNIAKVDTVEHLKGATAYANSDSCELAPEEKSTEKNESEVYQSSESKKKIAGVPSNSVAPASSIEVSATATPTKSFVAGDELLPDEKSVSEVLAVTSPNHDKESIEFTLSQTSDVHKRQGDLESMQNESSTNDLARVPEVTSLPVRDSEGYEVTLAQLQKFIEHTFSGEASSHQTRKNANTERNEASSTELAEHASKPVVLSADCNTYKKVQTSLPNQAQKASSWNSVLPADKPVCMSQTTKSIVSRSNPKSGKPPRANNLFRSMFPQKQACDVPGKISNVVELSESDTGGVEGAIIDTDTQKLDLHLPSSTVERNSENSDVEKITANVEVQGENIFGAAAISNDSSITMKQGDSLAPSTSPQDDQSTFETSIEVPMEGTKKEKVRSGLFHFGTKTKPKKTLVQARKESGTPENISKINSTLSSNQEELSAGKSSEPKKNDAENSAKVTVDEAQTNLVSSHCSNGTVQGETTSTLSIRQSPKIQSSLTQKRGTAPVVEKPPKVWKTPSGEPSSDHVALPSVLPQPENKNKPPKVWKTPSGKPSGDLVALPSVLPQPENKNKMSKRLPPKKSTKKYGAIPEKLPMPVQEKNRKPSQVKLLKQQDVELGRDSSQPVVIDNLKTPWSPVVGGTQDHVGIETNDSVQLDAMSNVPAINVAPREELSNLGILMECLTCQDCANTETNIPLRQGYESPPPTSKLLLDKQSSQPENGAKASLSTALGNSHQIPSSDTTPSVKKTPGKRQKQSSKISKPSSKNEKPKRKGMFGLFAGKQASNRKSNKNLRSMVTEVKAEKMMKSRRSQSPGRVALPIPQKCQGIPSQLPTASIPARDSEKAPLSPGDQQIPKKQIPTLQEPPSNDRAMGMWNPQRLLLYTNTYD